MASGIRPAQGQRSFLLTLSCGGCGKANAKLQQCSRCHFQKYCGEVCQKKHWPVHKQVCKLIPRGLGCPFLIERLPSPLEIKRWWLYNEWDPKCQFSEYIRPSFPRQAALHPETGDAKQELVEATFEDVRGRYTLWGSLKENARWTKMVVEKLALKWVEQHVKVLYPADTQFEVTELNGLVLWKNPDDEKYELIEGNHRVSAWLRSKKPASLHSIIFIGRPE